MEFRYRVFLAVANRLSFSKAAEELSISQPAVTTHIRELEKKLGISLFLRSGNQILLTSGGLWVYEYANQLLTLHTDLISKLNFLTYEAKGSLYIGTSQTIATYILPRLLGKFIHQFPELKVNLVDGTSDELEQKTLNNEIDAAIIENGTNHEELNYIHLMEEQIVGVTGLNNKKLSTDDTTFQELCKIPYIKEKKETDVSKSIEKGLKNHGLEHSNFQNQIHLKDIEAVKNCLAHSNGFSLLPKTSIEKELRLNVLKIISIKDLSIQRPFQAILSKKSDNKKAEYFIKILSQGIKR